VLKALKVQRTKNDQENPNRLQKKGVSHLKLSTKKRKKLKIVSKILPQAKNLRKL
jgi:hypothetical protein